MTNFSPDALSKADLASAAPPKGRFLPYIALTLVFPIPILAAFFRIAGSDWASLGVMLLSPIVGMMTGIAALCYGKKNIGLSGKVMSIIAIATPLAVLCFIVGLFYVATDGTFVLSM
jgi:hypothetical protein